MIATAQSPRRRSLRVRGAMVDSDVRDSVVRFASWLRTEVSFDQRVVVYLSPAVLIKNLKGDLVAATFFGPYDLRQEPYIRIATGDYPKAKRKHGRDNALAGILSSVEHEVVHYKQWLSKTPLNERGVTRQAARMIRKYAATTDHP